MSTSNSCSIKLLNKTYHLRCPTEEEQRLQSAAEKLDVLMHNNQKKFPALDEMQLLLLAALEVSHALVLKEQLETAPREEVDAFIQSLEERLQKVAQLGKDVHLDTFYDQTSEPS